MLHLDAAHTGLPVLHLDAAHTGLPVLHLDAAHTGLPVLRLDTAAQKSACLALRNKSGNGERTEKAYYCLCV